MRLRDIKHTQEQIREARRADVARRYRRRSGPKRTPAQLAALRLNDLMKLYQARYGVMLPDDDAGRDDLRIALAHIATLANSRSRMAGYLRQWAPWMTTGEAGSMIDAALTIPQYWTADQLAWRLHLTAAERAALEITTIGAVDMPKAARLKLRKRKDRDRKRAARKARKIAAASAP